MVLGDFTFTPKLPEKATAGAKKTLKLTPYGFSELRVTALPKIVGGETERFVGRTNKF